MIDNKVRYEVDASGAYLTPSIGSVRALSDYTTILELVSPLPLNTSVMVNFLVYDARNIDLPLFLIPIDKKGWQVSDNPQVSEWNVWEVGVDQKALAAISKYRAGRIGVSFTFRERRPSNIAIDYKGIFDANNPLPLSSDNEGDYYVCKGYNVNVSGVLYTYNDNAVWDGFKWVRDRNMRTIATTTTTDLPVDPSLLANVPNVPPQDIADIIAEWGEAFVNAMSKIPLQGGLTGQALVKNSDADFDFKFEYLDDAVVGDVMIGTARAYTESLPLSGLRIIDNVELMVDDRVLVAGQGELNGIYIVQEGAWLRETTVIRHQVVSIDDGDVYGGSQLKKLEDGTTKVVKKPERQKWVVK